METNIEATFSNWKNLELAVDMLRREGAIDIRVYSPVLADPSGSRSSTNTSAAPILSSALMEASSLPDASQHAFPLQVFVQPSRSRQAEDTILRFGGSLTHISAE